MGGLGRKGRNFHLAEACATGGDPLVKFQNVTLLALLALPRCAGQQVASVCEQVCVVSMFLDFEA